MYYICEEVKLFVVNIEVKEGSKYAGVSAFVSFPYSLKYVNLMRKQPCRYWHADIKCWEIPYSDINPVLEELGTDYKLVMDKSLQQEMTEAKQVDIPKDYKFKTKPYQHQEEGVVYGLNHKKFLLGDEQGLGKSKQMLDLAVINKKLYGFKHCFIIACVNGLKYNWQEEVGIHTNEQAYILGTRVSKRGKTTIGSNKDRLEDLKNLDKIDSYFIITNIETLRYTTTEQVPCKTKNKNGTVRYKKITKFPIVEELQKLIKSEEISMIVVDEVHKCKDSTALQGRALLSLNAPVMVALTGTPLMNNAIDLYTPLKFIGAEKHSLYAFKQHYCICGGFGGHQIVGYKNLPDLQLILDKYMLRRLKSEVLDLPDKIYINDFVEMTSSQSQIYDWVLEDIQSNIDKVKLSPNPLTALIRLRQATGNPLILSTTAKGNPKFDRMVELIEGVVEDGSKAIVFSNWTDVLEPAFELLLTKGFNPALYTGKNKDTREDEKYKFKHDPSCKVICGTIGAMGTGLTLTEATTVIFLDEPWNRAIKDQAEDRAHRIGTTEHLNVITLMCKDTIDEKIHNIVYRKGKMSDIIVDKEEDLFKNPGVINYLLSTD